MPSRKTRFKFLVVLLIMLLAAPTAFAAEQVKFIFNGREYKADITLKDGVSYISAKDLARIPGLEVGDEPEVPIRQLFESQGGKVSWDNDNWQVIVSWREKAGDFTADELVIKSSELLKEANSYKMQGNLAFEFEVEGNEIIKEILGMSGLGMDMAMEGVFQNEPMAMYLKQTVKMPLEDLGLSPEELEAAGLGEDMVTEMVWHENKIYQKNPMMDQWIYQDLAGMEEIFDINNLMQITPQQSIDMMNKAGVINVFGEDVERDGKEYYTIKNYIDAESFKSLMEEVLGKMDFASFMAAFAGQFGEEEDIAPQFEQVFDIMLNTMTIDYCVDTLIDKETLLSDFMTFDLEMKIDVKQVLEAMAEMMEIEEDEEAPIPEGLIIKIKMKGDFELSDYGTELELPDLSNAISQEEYIQQLMEEMAETEELMEQEIPEEN